MAASLLTTSVMNHLTWNHLISGHEDDSMMTEWNNTPVVSGCTPRSIF